MKIIYSFLILMLSYSVSIYAGNTDNVIYDAQQSSFLQSIPLLSVAERQEIINNLNNEDRTLIANLRSVNLPEHFVGGVVPESLIDSVLIEMRDGIFSIKCCWRGGCGISVVMVCFPIPPCSGRSQMECF